MARDGNGSYSLPEAAFVYDTVIDETAVNSNFSDIASALTASIAKDGQTTPTANLPMGTYKHTGVGNASARDQYASMGQVQDGAGIWCGTAGGTADAITLTPSPAIPAYAAGQRFEFKAGSASNTGAVTFAISGLSTISGQVRGAACAAGDIAANQWYRITLSDANTAQIEPLGEWINGTAIGSGKVPQWNGSAWVGVTPGAGTVTSIIAGTGLTGGTITSSGTIAVDVGTEAGKIVQLDGSAKLPAVDGSQLTGLSVTDTTARDQIALTNIRLLLNSAVATGGLVQGYQWELSTDEWSSGSTNQVLTSGSPNYYTGYSNTTLTTGGTNIGTNLTAGGGFAAAFDGITSQVAASSAYNGSAPAYGAVGKDWGAGVTKTVTSFTAYRASNLIGFCNVAGLTIKLQGSSDNSSWTDLWSGTDSGSASITVNSGINTSTAYRYHRFYVAGNSSNDIAVAELIMYQEVNNNMTLISPSITVPSAPQYADVYALYKDDSGSAVLGTDLTIEISRDGGTTYTTATVTSIASYDGTYSIIRGRANVSSQPSGTSLKGRIKTLNTKAQRIAAPAIYAE